MWLVVKKKKQLRVTWRLFVLLIGLLWDNIVYNSLWNTISTYLHISVNATTHSSQFSVATSSSIAIWAMLFFTTCKDYILQKNDYICIYIQWQKVYKKSSHTLVTTLHSCLLSNVTTSNMISPVTLYNSSQSKSAHLRFQIAMNHIFRVHVRDSRRHLTNNMTSFGLCEMASFSDHSEQFSSVKQFQNDITVELDEKIKIFNRRRLLVSIYHQNQIRIVSTTTSTNYNNKKMNHTIRSTTQPCWIISWSSVSKHRKVDNQWFIVEKHNYWLPLGAKKLYRLPFNKYQHFPKVFPISFQIYESSYLTMIRHHLPVPKFKNRHYALPCRSEHCGALQYLYVLGKHQELEVLASIENPTFKKKKLINT